MRHLLFCCITACALFAQSKDTHHLVTPQSLVLPQDSPPDSVAARVAHADALLANITLEFEPAKAGGSTIKERPCSAACLDERTGRWYVVRFMLPYPMKSYFNALKKAHTVADREKCSVLIRTCDVGFRVTHKGGAGPTLLTVAVEKEDSGVWHTLTPYRLLFSRLPGKEDANLLRVRKNVRLVRSTPVVPVLAIEGLAKDGEQLLRDHLKFALASLAEAQVQSRAFPGKALAEVFPPEVVMALMVSEQWDPLYFEQARESSLRRILATYAVNREHAYEWSTSSADAIGCLQFTNVHGNGTYASVVRAYPSARLVRKFEDGARDMHNVVKAAICLLDMELAQSEEAKKAFLMDPFLGALYPVAAYNGGHGNAEKVLAEIKRINAAPLSRLDRALLSLPKAVSRRAEVSTKKKRRKSVAGNTETPLYGKKYLYLVEYFVH